MTCFRIRLGFVLLAIEMNRSVGVEWEHLHCSSDATQETPEGTVGNIGRFPWLGIVQHSFYIAGKVQFAVTGAVLVHPAFAIAAAEDIAKIGHEQLANNTKLILWSSKADKYALDVKDYILHPEYGSKVTFATIALLDLIAWGDSGMSEWKAPVLPICMPVKGSGTFSQMYAVKMTDASGAMEKELLKMNIVDNQDCEEFYYKAQLTYKKMSPVNPLCAVSASSKIPCVWDAGTALITRQSWGFWKLIGFAVRGPGCGAPTRFLNMHDYLPWINDIITRIPYQDYEDTYKLVMRRVSPIKLIMYKSDVVIPKSQGQCERGLRGNVVYKDSSELLANKNFAQGFYYAEISQMAQFKCVEVSLDVNSRTNAAVWLEHSCHRDVMGTPPPKSRGWRRPDIRKVSCFYYFKTTAHLEFRFYFSFRALIEVSVYGSEDTANFIPNPFKSTQPTYAWYPTTDYLRLKYFVPGMSYWWDM